MTELRLSSDSNYTYAGNQQEDAPRPGLRRKEIDMPRRSKSYSKAIIDRDGR
jgi:hypothetical protein